MPSKLSPKEYGEVLSTQNNVKAEITKSTNSTASGDSSGGGGKVPLDCNGVVSSSGKPCIKEEPNINEDDESTKDNDVKVVAVSTNTRSGRISMRLRLKKEKVDTSPSPPQTKRSRRSAAKGNKAATTSRTDEPIEVGSTEIKVETSDDAAATTENNELVSDVVQVDILDEENRRGLPQKEASRGHHNPTTNKTSSSRGKGTKNATCTTPTDRDRENSESEDLDEIDKDDPPWKPSVERRRPESNVDRNLDQAVEGLIKDYSVIDESSVQQSQACFPSPQASSSLTSDVCSSTRDSIPPQQEHVSLEFEGIVAVPVESTKCILCMALFKTTGELKAHMEIVHAKGRRQAKTRVTPVEETDSRKKAPTPLVREGAEAKPRRRKPRQAGNLGHHECHFCHKRFQQMGHLRNHVRLHTGERPFVCDMCGKEFSQSGHLVSHINSHTNTRPYECQYCQKRFTQSGHLRNHERLHLGVRPYQCAQCGKSFTQSGHLVNHLRLHDGEKPFGCPFCGKRFTQSGHLSTHVKTHNEGRGHECNICFKRFAQASHLEEHSRIHSDLRTYVCAFTACSARFSTGALLSVHVQLHEQTGQHVEKRGRTRERQNCPPATSAPQSYLPDNITPLVRHPVIVRVGRDHVDNDEEDRGRMSFVSGNEDAAFVQAVMAPGVEVELLGEQVEL
ncbi:zinc finger and BTB domain-containing protein 17-like isoform X2 [Varroa destructor]|uniref:C2H2-type domain-containing protein n=1 Tax=Varroa destructor TaxID=109461 RepID=A0A7M7K4Y3_VARDE|nr:zinc finger and BTB domain-containing protein 17-like isoform X2 [Varroa destructor]